MKWRWQTELRISSAVRGDRMHQAGRAGGLCETRAVRSAEALLTVYLVVASTACAEPREVPEMGALLLQVHSESGARLPDGLRVSVYDDGGALFKNARVPDMGTITGGRAEPSVSAAELGTVLIQPGATHGSLRIHVRAFKGRARLSDGAARIPDDARQSGVFDLSLRAPLLTDRDHDDVPDEIDDCLLERNPEQKGCSGGAPFNEAAVGDKSNDMDAR